MFGLGLNPSHTTECGIFGSYTALELDGNGAYVRIGDEFINDVNMNSGTASIWINIRENNASGSQVIFRITDDSTNNGVTLQYAKNYTEFRAVYRLDATYKEATYNEVSFDHDAYMDQGWINLAMTWVSDGAGSGEVKIYYNGTLKETVAQTSNWASDGSDQIDVANIGSNDGGESSFVDGYIDQAAFYNMVKTDEAITSIYNEGIKPDLTTSFGNYDPSGLIGYYQFEKNFLDSSIRGNDAGSVNSTRFTPIEST